MKNLMKFFLILNIFLFLSCSRDKNKSKVEITFPTYSKVSGLSCTSCLKFIVVNVTGPGISKAIYQKKEHPNFKEIGTELVGSIEVEVPAGEARFFQVAAVYVDAAGNIEITYNSKSTNLSSGYNEFSLGLNSLGNFQGGSIVGRYLTSSDTGPTGEVNVNLVPYTGVPGFTIFKTHILNGWFNFFASQNFEIDYVMNDGRVLFSNTKLDTTFSSASLVGNSQVVRATRPVSYYRYEEVPSPSWIFENNDYSDIVFGYFFAPGFSDANKIICKEEVASPANFTNLASDSGGLTKLTYDVNGNGTGVNVYGGVLSSDSTSCPSFSSATAQFNLDRIYIRKNQFDGNDNDHAGSIDGAFSYTMASGQVSNHSVIGNTFTFKTLSGLFGAGKLFDGIKLFHIAATPSSSDNIKCSSTELANLGFTELALNGAPTLTADDISVTVSSAITSGEVMVCPTTAGVLQGFGGMYVGQMHSAAILQISGASPANFILGGTATTATLTVQNVGGSSANSITNSTSWANGYSLQSSTCGSSLNVGSSCTLNLEFAPASASSLSQTVVVNYNDGYGGARSATKTLTASGLNPASLSISDAVMYDFSTVVVGGFATHFFTVTNSGDVAATSLSDAGSLAVPFGYNGGSYPGTSGTCGTSLSSGSSCTIEVKFAPTATGLSSDMVELSYNDGLVTQTATRGVQGTGVP